MRTKLAAIALTTLALLGITAGTAHGDTTWGCKTCITHHR